MSLQQQIKKLTRSIRQQKDERQRLRQLLQEKTRAKGMEQVEVLRQALIAQDHDETTLGACAELVQIYVKQVLGCDSYLTDLGRERGMGIRWSQPLKGEDRLEHYYVEVKPGGEAVNLYLDCAGNLAGEGEDFHVVNDPVKDWPI